MECSVPVSVLKLTREQQKQKRHEQLLELGGILREKRIEAGLSQRQLAEKLTSDDLRVQKGAISRAENGQRLSEALLSAYNRFFALSLEPPIKITVNPAIAESNRRRKGVKKYRKAKTQSRSRAA